MTLRLSVTERCNFRCRYCAPIKGFPVIPYNELPSLDQLANATAWLVLNCHVKRVKITGGEPLLRAGVVEMVRDLANVKRIDEISLTTNGSALKTLARPLKLAGLNRVNISLDTVNANRFHDLCGGNIMDVLTGIESAKQANLIPIKLNSVLHKSTWNEDVPALMDYAAAEKLELRFIELMQIGPAQDWARREFVPATEVIDWLKSKANVTNIEHVGSAPARQAKISWMGTEVLTGWITPESDAFCTDCDRLRLDSHGRLRRCLMDTVYLPLVDILQGEGNDAALVAIEAYLNGKQAPKFMRADHSMIAVGG